MCGFVSFVWETEWGLEDIHMRQDFTRGAINIDIV